MTQAFRRADAPGARRRSASAEAEAGQALIATPFCLAGAMAPITIAGALSLQHAEALAAIKPRLDPEALDAALSDGRAMSLDEVMAEAWAVADDAR